MEKMIELALENFDVEIEQRMEQANGETVLSEAYLNTFDRETGLLVMAIPLHRRATRAEVETAAKTFLERRNEYLESDS